MGVNSKSEIVISFADCELEDLDKKFIEGSKIGGSEKEVTSGNC